MAKHAGILYRAGSKVLLMKRRPDDHMGGLWAFPAGKVEENETAFKAAFREFAEETGKSLRFSDGYESDLGVYGDFHLFGFEGNEFIPVLNSEHTEWQWAEHTALPEGLHPGVAEQIARAFSSEITEALDAATAREFDRNGYVTIHRNPITRAGVFQYLGRSLPDAEDPDKVYNVYRPLEEISDPEALKSMALLPIINEHEMLGDGYQRGAEDRGVHGATGEEIVVEGMDVLAPIRIFSRALKQLIESGKKGLSLGYRCRFEKSAGEFQGMRYDYIQREIRGNHLALVNEGRSGTAVLDHHWACDSFDLALDNGEAIMAVKETEKQETAAQDEAEMTPAQMSAAIRGLTASVSKLTHAMDEMAKKEACDEDKDSKAEDADEEEKKDKAEDSDSDEKKDKAEDADEEEKDAMDAAEIRKEIAGVKSAIPTEKALRAQLANTDALAKRIAGHVGTFDHSAMDEAEVVAYGVEKLKVKAPKGAEKVALGAFLDALDSKKETAAFAMDSGITPKQGGLLAKRLNGAQA